MRLLIALLLVACGTAFAADEPLSFKGLALGTGEPEVLKYYPAARCTGDAVRRMCVLGFTEASSRLRKPDGSLDTDAVGRLKTSMSVGGAGVVRIVFTLRDDKLESILLSPVAAQFDNMAAAITKRYGKPASDESMPLVARAGVQLENRKMAWTFTDGMIRVARYGSTIDESTVGVHSIDALKRMTGDAAEARKRAAKDL